MDKKGPAGLVAFVAVGFFLAAWQLAPDEDSHPMMWVVAGGYAFAGAVLMLQWLTRAEARPSPWRSWGGRLLWAVRPRLWMVAWALILVAATAFGTPHVLWRYQIGAISARCDYVGLRGVVHDSRAGTCPLVALQ